MTQDEFVTEDGVFDADRYQAEVGQEPYPFHWAGRRWQLAHVMDLDDSILDLIGSDDLTTEHIRTVIVAAFGVQQWQELIAIKRLPIKVTVEVFNRWLTHCGVDPGEAASSATSSPGTAGRSKLTSTATTRSGSTRRSTAAKKTASRRGRS